MTAREKAMLITKITEWLDRELHTDNETPTPPSVTKSEQPAELLTLKRMYGARKRFVGAHRPTARRAWYHSKHTHRNRKEQQDTHKQDSPAELCFGDWR